jgi:hypothetical protein
MFGVAFQFDGPAVPIPYQQTAASAATTASRSIIIRSARSHLLRWDEIRDGVLHWGALATGQSRARDGKPSRLQKITPTGEGSGLASGNPLVLDIAENIEATTVLVCVDPS